LADSSTTRNVDKLQDIVTVVERKSGYAVTAKVSKKSTALIGQAIIKARRAFEARVKTLAYNDGEEFCGHALYDKALKSTSYLARPFAIWERGTKVVLGFCQNFIGLLRQYVPQKWPMENINDEEIKMMENRLNHCPRKRLGFRTPAEVFHQS